jgi:hypothetical protein
MYQSGGLRFANPPYVLDMETRMDTAIIFDCEFLVVEGAPQNFWCGPFDPDPMIAQIGAAKLGLGDDFPILDTMRLLVKPVDRHATIAKLVMPGLVPGIHVLASLRQERRGWPGQARP